MNYQEGNSRPDDMPPATARPVKQSSEYRDVLFASLFVAQFAVVTFISIQWFPTIFQQLKDNIEEDSKRKSDDVEDIELNIKEFLILLTVSFGAALLSSGLCFMLMTMHAKRAVQLSFFTTPAITIISALVWTCVKSEDHQLNLDNKVLWCTVAVTCVVAAVFYFFARHYISFAASNLHTALTALRAHKGLFGLALVSSVLVYVWAVVWAVAALGLYQQIQGQEPPPSHQVPCGPESSSDDTCYEQDKEYQPYFVTVFMLLSFFWTTQVLQNVLHTTTAGTIGSWWFRDGSSSDMMASLSRACTLSFGSICLGSLLVAAIQVLERVVAHMANENKKKNNDKKEKGKDSNRNRRMAYSFLQRALRWLRRLAEYFNSWAFVYVGLYGYGYVTAGKTVASMFRQQGWGTFVSDQLVYRVLSLAKFSIALLSGILTLAVHTVLGNTQDEATTWFLFGSAMIFGYLLSNTSLFVVESAVRTVIVCFAESPNGLKCKQPKLHKELQHGWSKAYPKAWAERGTQNVHAHME